MVNLVGDKNQHRINGIPPGQLTASAQRVVAHSVLFLKPSALVMYQCNFS